MLLLVGCLAACLVWASNGKTWAILYDILLYPAAEKGSVAKVPARGRRLAHGTVAALGAGLEASNNLCANVRVTDRRTSCQATSFPCNNGAHSAHYCNALCQNTRQVAPHGTGVHQNQDPSNPQRLVPDGMSQGHANPCETRILNPGESQDHVSMEALHPSCGTPHYWNSPVLCTCLAWRCRHLQASRIPASRALISPPPTAAIPYRVHSAAMHQRQLHKCTSIQ